MMSQIEFLINCVSPRLGGAHFTPILVMLPSNYCCGVFFAILIRDTCHYRGCVYLMMQEGIERDLSGKLHVISYVPLGKKE